MKGQEDGDCGLIEVYMMTSVQKMNKSEGTKGLMGNWA